MAWSTVGRKHKNELLTRCRASVIYVFCLCVCLVVSEDGADYSKPTGIYVVTESGRLAHFSRNIIVHSIRVTPE